MNEIWKDIKGYEGLYQISNKGRVKSLTRIIHQKGKFGTDTIHIYPETILKQIVGHNGYMRIDLHKNQCVKRHLVHRLVGMHFVPNHENKPFINHLDSNPQNNCAENLEWCTQSENIKYAYDQCRKTPPHQKPIGQYTEDMKLIKIWPNAAMIGREMNNVSAPNILKVCNNKRLHAGGYKWAYIE